ncbi:TRAP transporter substrate-binding protein DctP [Georgenia sp. AZ-5]|uniref:TRAP transporter substrate-binding protein DctP n=1 Tax=Georgenia sp. AZ-5 TaxID=3367526 RepID=UPI0037546194
MDATELTVQLASGPDNPYSQAVVAYADAITEWSDGKITFDILYSGSRVPLQEMNDALAEGLVDMGQHMPSIAPDTFPVVDYAAQLTFLNEGSPVVGALQLVGVWSEFGATDEALHTELRDRGVQPLLPMMVSGSAGLICNGERNSLDELHGTQIRTSATAVAAGIEALGGVPVSVPAPEQYEAMQRGVVDCVASALGNASVYGLHEVADTWVLDERVMFPGAPVAWSISAATWDGLPLVARQLLWDRLDVFVEEYAHGNIVGSAADALSQSEEAGLTVMPWADDAAETLLEHHQAVLAELPDRAPSGVDGQQTVDTVIDLHDKWLSTVEELGHGKDVTWPTYTSWAQDDHDFADFADIIREEVLVPHRPE